MRIVPRKTAWRIIYWNAVLAILVVCLGAISLLHKIHRFDQLIVEVCQEHRLDPRLVSAVIWQESRFDPTQVGQAGEIGLMQVTETAAREWAESCQHPLFEKKDLFDPRTNLRAGCWYLARAIRRWEACPDPLPFALAEYNAGRSNAQRWADISGPDSRRFYAAITFPTTRRYIEKILRRYRGHL